MRIYIFLLIFLFTLSCNSESPEQPAQKIEKTVAMDLETAEYLASLPLDCIQTEYPYKSHLIIAKAEDLELPIVHHPAFYGCFDWHSAVHGHWSLVYLLKSFPDISIQAQARKMLLENLTQENIEKEIEYFSLNSDTKSFERTYGWAWLFKLAEELKVWDDPQAKVMLENLMPLAEHISKEYVAYLPKLVYPIRVGEHSNSAFGMSFAHDYAVAFKDEALKEAIETSARKFYMNDAGCPITWEPSGYDFLSPCLQEIDIMRKVLDANQFKTWLSDFMPSITNGSFDLEAAEVLDRSDGKLVHLDGLNYSRAWCLYPLAGSYPESLNLADAHFNHSIEKIKAGDYAGGHWLGSFALYALKMKSENAQ